MVDRVLSSSAAPSVTLSMLPGSCSPRTVPRDHGCGRKGPAAARWRAASASGAPSPSRAVAIHGKSSLGTLAVHRQPPSPHGQQPSSSSVQTPGPRPARTKRGEVLVSLRLRTRSGSAPRSTTASSRVTAMRQKAKAEAGVQHRPFPQQPPFIAIAEGSLSAIALASKQQRLSDAGVMPVVVQSGSRRAGAHRCLTLPRRKAGGPQEDGAPCSWHWLDEPVPGRRVVRVPRARPRVRSRPGAGFVRLR
jgi:hypothetical protein